MKVESATVTGGGTVTVTMTVFKLMRWAPGGGNFEMTLTITLLSALVFILIVYDIWALRHFGLPGTISWVVWTNSRRFPLIPLLVGILAGHLWWRQEAPKGQCDCPIPLQGQK